VTRRHGPSKMSYAILTWITENHEGRNHHAASVVHCYHKVTYLLWINDKFQSWQGNQGKLGWKDEDNLYRRDIRWRGGCTPMMMHHMTLRWDNKTLDATDCQFTCRIYIFFVNNGDLTWTCVLFRQRAYCYILPQQDALWVTWNAMP
jgi:hypothetical protein